MKRPLFIIIGIVFVIILLAIWIYVLFFGGPQRDDGEFSDLDFGDTNDPSVIIDQSQSEDESIVNVTGPERLRQLTTKRVIGFEQVVNDASSTPMIYFAEAGVGHMYSINLESGEERRISATTIPTSNLADFTPNGEYVMVRSGIGSQAEVLVGALSTSSDTLSTRVLESGIVDFTSTRNNTFLYAVRTNTSVIAKEYSPTSDTTRTLFTIPFRETTIRWGETANGTHYAYPKTTTRLEGFAFKITNGNLRRIAADGYGFSIFGNASYALFSAQVNDAYKSFTYNDETRETTEFSLNTIPEKCTSFIGIDSGAICAQTITNYDHQVPDSWYQGRVTYADNLWEVDLENGGATLLLNTLNESGRELDIINLEMDPTNEVVYFQNKNDYALWVFERIQQQ